MVQVTLDAEFVKGRKVDDRGRVYVGKDYSGKEIEIAVATTEDEDEDE